MKRYLAFYGDNYYPDGGMRDFICDYETIEECELSINEAHINTRPEDTDWAWAWKLIWDSKERKSIIDTY